MIGDWVYCIRDNTYRQILSFDKIQRHSKKGDSEYMWVAKLDAGSDDGGQRIIVYALEDLRPIQLTEEIIEKTFKYMHLNIAITFLHQKNSFRLSDEPTGNPLCKPILIGIDLTVCNDKVDGVFKKITYVHELQHALRTAGINIGVSV